MRCDQCKFWLKKDSQEWDQPDDLEGQCRRYPPQHTPAIVFVTLLEDNRNGETSYDSAIRDSHCSTAWTFPVTSGDEWCGEFAAAQETR